MIMIRANRIWKENWKNLKKNAKKGLRKGKGSRNTLKIEDIEAVFAERSQAQRGTFKFFSVLCRRW